MITLLSSLKPFRGDVARLQENALRNWRRLGKDVEIILYGDGEGVAEHARRYAARHVPVIDCSAKGIPRFDAIVAHAATEAKYDLQLYLNGDILIPPDTINHLGRVTFKQFLVVGQRIDLGQRAEFDPVTDRWSKQIADCFAQGEAQLHGPFGSDYFVFPRGFWHGLPPLVIGRGAYDNALLAFCLRKGAPLIDATRALPIVHQWHDYSHVPGAFNEAHHGPDAVANRRLHDIVHGAPSLMDADWQMCSSTLAATDFRGQRLRRWEVLLRYRWDCKLPSYLLRAACRAVWTTGMPERSLIPLDSILN